ncbi:hypothetical protein D2Q93_04175 [Alicyclobacillaceae bacterium I2511]|nr:hypothetical protein D2Q93_04175 [Alicyclobacillaceae bacterium I2511]
MDRTLDFKVLVSNETQTLSDAYISMLNAQINSHQGAITSVKYSNKNETAAGRDSCAALVDVRYSIEQIVPPHDWRATIEALRTSLKWAISYLDFPDAALADTCLHKLYSTMYRAEAASLPVYLRSSQNHKED